MKKASIALVALFILIISCSKSKFEEHGDISDGKEYVALEMGKFREFQYDTIAYSGTTRDTLRGFLKYEIGESYLNNAGTTTFDLLVYHKVNSGDDYQLVRVESIRIEGNKLIESQNGLNFIKLSFPLSERSGWLGNSLFDVSESITEEIIGDNVVTFKAGVDWQYEVVELGVPIESGMFNFDDGVVINQIRDTSGVELRNVTEYFAREVGMVKKEATILTRGNTTSNPIIQDADVGYVMTFRLIDHN